jgi:hypothetical protein
MVGPNGWDQTEDVICVFINVLSQDPSWQGENVMEDAQHHLTAALPRELRRIECAPPPSVHWLTAGVGAGGGGAHTILRSSAARAGMRI